ncbi:LysR family transcriptional regulator [Arthrobacter sp. D3-16]
MDIRQLECFFMVAEELHFGRSAEKLGRSQAAVSETIAALERDLGGDLFARTTRSVRLTRFGERCVLALRPRYENLVDEYRALRRSRPRSQLAMAYTPQLAQFILPHWVTHLIDNDITELARAWLPHVMHSQQQVVATLEGMIDIGLCWEPRPHVDLAVTRVARCQLALILPASDPLSEQESIALGSLHGRRILVSPSSHHAEIDAMVRAAVLQSGLHVSQIEETASYDELGLAVIAGAGFGLHPATLAATSRVPGIVFRPLSDVQLSADICVVSRRDSHDPRVAQVTTILGKVVSDAVDMLPGVEALGVWE